MSALIILIAAILLFSAYRLYASFLEKCWGIDPSRETPAHKYRDGIDFVPAKKAVLMGHHFASIAGAAPIIGPVAAAVYGWAPVLLWVLGAGIFFGAVHDFGALLISVRHDGANLGQLLDKYLGTGCKRAFLLFIWITSLIVIAAFVSIVASTFTITPSAAAASTYFVVLALVFGYAVTKRGLKILPATIIGVALVVICVIAGQAFPIALPENAWIVAVLGYIIISSVTPIWMLLQPRDYLNSFLLYALIAGAFTGFLFVRPGVHIPAFTKFSPDGQPLFPIMFLVVACGAISGFHAMFASTTTSMQIGNERDIKPVAFGGMLLEVFLAVIALLVAASFLPARYTELRAAGGPIIIFSTGLSDIAGRLGLPPETISQLVVLTIASFALTSLDSVTRVARIIFQDMARDLIPVQRPALQRMVCAKLPAAAITVVLGGLLAMRGWQTLWPLFGSANQLIASFTFMTLFLWLRRSKKASRMIIFPMLFMFVVAVSGLVIIFYVELGKANYTLPLFSLILTVLGMAFAKKALRSTLGNE